MKDKLFELLVANRQIEFLDIFSILCSLEKQYKCPLFSNMSNGGDVYEKENMLDLCLVFISYLCVKMRYWEYEFKFDTFPSSLDGAIIRRGNYSREAEKYMRVLDRLFYLSNTLASELDKNVDEQMSECFIRAKSFIRA